MDRSLIESRKSDPWENRTPVTAVKGRCLNRLTNGPKNTITLFGAHIKVVLSKFLLRKNFDG